MNFSVFVIILFTIWGVHSSKPNGDHLPLNRRLSGPEKFKLQWLEFINAIASDPKLTKEWDQIVAENNDVTPAEWEFPTPLFECTNTAPSPTTPTSVHKLRPGDINVVGTFGDSITAGNGVGAETLLEVAIENRAEVWTAGMDRTLDDGVITIPNIIRKFNPDVTGGSICRGFYGIPPNARKTFLNVAEPGGTHKDMEKQAQMIVERSKSDDRVDHENDWKLITLFIGGNDLCGSCDSREPDGTDPDMTPEMYRASIEGAIDILKAGLPRTFFNLVAMFDITPLLQLSAVNGICWVSHYAFCECIKTHTKDLRERNYDYYLQLKDLVDSGKYDGNDEFTVVLQPMFVNSTPPIDPLTGIVDRKFVSPDCFHPSRKAHHSFTYGLWNSMFIPVGQKPLTVDESVPVAYKCPSEEFPYIFTKDNSPPPPEPTVPEPSSAARLGSFQWLLATSFISVAAMNLIVV